MTTCLDAVDTRIDTLGYMDGVDEEALHIEYTLFQDEETAASVKPKFVPMTKAEREAYKEKRFADRENARIRKEKRAAREAKKDPQDLLAEVEAKLEELHDNRAVVYATQVSFDRGDSFSGSTGISQEYREVAAKRDALKGIKSAKRGPKAGAVAQGKTRNGSVANAKLKVNHRIRIVTDSALAANEPMWMQTVTFDMRMPLEMRIEFGRRLEELFSRSADNYVFVWGIGDKKLNCPVDGEVERKRLHLHMHCFHFKSVEILEKAIQNMCEKDKAFSRYIPCMVNNQEINPEKTKAMGYHMAWYGSGNLKPFNSFTMDKLVEKGIYTKGAMGELDLARSKVTFQMYYSGRETNRLLEQRTIKKEVSIERIGQDAANQLALHFHDVTRRHIEKTNFCVSEDGSKFYIHYDVTTEKAFRRRIAKPIKPGENLPPAFYRAWTLHKEAGYQPSRAFMTYVMRYADVYRELENKRIARKFHDISPTEFFDAEDGS